MKIIVAIDSLKGSLTSLEAGAAARDGILSVSRSDVKIFPLADGGEGTCRAIIDGLGGELKSATVCDPLGGKVVAEFGEVASKKLAVIEMANAAGLPLVPDNLRNPLNTTTYGVGELIRLAIDDGCRNFLIGIGGSATNDCGIGMLTALGYKFVGADGVCGRDLEKISAVDDSNALPALKECTFRIACDVTNPLTGANGCSAIYGPQKGATPEIIATMDGWIKNFGELSAKFLHLEKNSVAGDGAAGGIGFAFRAYLRGELVPGVELVLDALDIASELKSADVVITGEGRLDSQTAQGKAPSGVAKLAKKLNPKILTVGLGGSVADISVDDAGLDAAFAILRAPMSLAQAMDKKIAADNISATTAQIIRLIERAR